MKVLGIGKLTIGFGTFCSTFNRNAILRHDRWQAADTAAANDYQASNPGIGRVCIMASNDRNKDVEHFNRWSHTYDDSWIQRYADRMHAEMLDVVTNEIAAPNTVLDVGCGTGRLLRKARALYPSAQLVGIDPAQGMVEIARDQLPSATIYLAAAESLPLADCSVDVVLSSISFHHWSDQIAALREIRRVLRAGGCFCLADISMPVWLAKLLRHSKVKSPAAMSQIFNEAGLPVKVQHRTFTRFVLLTLGVKELRGV